MMGRLAAITTILRTAAGLDAEKPAELNLVGIEMFAMNGLRLKQQIIEGGVMERQSLFPRPTPVEIAGCRRQRSGFIRARWEHHIPSWRNPKPHHGRSMQPMPDHRRCRNAEFHLARSLTSSLRPRTLATLPMLPH